VGGRGCGHGPPVSSLSTPLKGFSETCQSQEAWGFYRKNIAGADKMKTWQERELLARQPGPESRPKLS